MKKLKLLAAVMLLSAGYTSLASAHTVSSSLGNSTTDAAATDVFDVVCTDNSMGVTDHLFYQVMDIKTNPEKATKVSIQIAALGATSPLYIDTIDTDALYAPNPGATFKKGAVTYRVTVSKPKVAGVLGPETYVAQVHCQDVGNNHTAEPDSPNWIQNQ